MERVKLRSSHARQRLTPSPPAWLPAAPWKLQVEKQLWCWPGAAGAAQGSLLHVPQMPSCPDGETWEGPGQGLGMGK